MSMYRQLWFATLLSTLLALTGGLLASTLSARSYLTEQLHMKNMDNASALALSLSQGEPDKVSVSLVAAALFDSGHYELIRVTNPRGETLVELQAGAAEMQEVPAWFTRMLPIEAKPGYARISSGWKQFGNVTLVSHSRFAYRALWHSVLEMIAALAAAGVIGGLLATLVLRRIKRPLDDVINQARAITERRFVTIEEPSVPELRSLAAAMNSTVGRLKAMFEEEAARLEQVRREANCDALTGLFNREYFLAGLQACVQDEEIQGGSLLLIRVANLAETNRRLGRTATDDLLRRIGNAIADHAAAYPNSLAARLNGADFALLLPASAGLPAHPEQLLQAINHAADGYLDALPAAYIGQGDFNHGGDVGALLAGVDNTLICAEAAGDAAPRVTSDGIDADAPRSNEQWQQLLRHALDNRWLRLVTFPVADFSNRLIHHDCPLRLMFDERGGWLPAGRFIPIAERLGMTPDLDLTALELALEELRRHANITGLAVNMSATSLQSQDFRRNVRGLLGAQPDLAGKVWLDIAETSAFLHLESLQQLAAELAGSGVRIGLEHFGRQFSQIGRLHNMGLDYLKVEASFVRSIDSNPGNQAFLKGLATIAHGIGLQVYAQGVSSRAELDTLALLGFDGATGPAIKL